MSARLKSRSALRVQRVKTPTARTDVAVHLASSLIVTRATV